MKSALSWMRITVAGREEILRQRLLVHESGNPVKHGANVHNAAGTSARTPRNFMAAMVRALHSSEETSLLGEKAAGRLQARLDELGPTTALER